MKSYRNSTGDQSHITRSCVVQEHSVCSCLVIITGFGVLQQAPPEVPVLQSPFIESRALTAVQGLVLQQPDQCPEQPRRSQKLNQLTLQTDKTTFLNMKMKWKHWLSWKRNLILCTQVLNFFMAFLTRTQIYKYIHMI